MLTLSDMTANQSVSADGADVLRAIGSAGHSFLVYALPRNAGKSTLTNAILSEAPDSIPRREFFGTEEEVRTFAAAPQRGYLIVGEIGHRGRAGYLAGDEVPRLFRLLAGGYSLASSLHADSVEGVFDVLRANGIGTAEAVAAVSHVVKVRALGDPDEESTRRVVEQVHAITPRTDGGYDSSLLYRWDGAELADRPA